MSAAPGNQTPTVVAGPGAGDRRRTLFAAAVVVGLVVVAVGVWLLSRGSGTDVEGTAIGEAVSAPTGSTPGGTVPATDPGSPASASPAEPPGTTGTTGTAQSLVDPGLLGTVLITEKDLGGIAITLEEATYPSGQDPDHPLTDYAYCNRPLDRSQAGGSAKRVLTTNPLSPDGIVASTATAFTSYDAASAVVDQMVANALACETYTVSGGALPATVTIKSAERTKPGAIIVEHVETVGSSADITVVVDQVNDLVTTLEVTPASPDPTQLESLLTSRAADLRR